MNKLYYLSSCSTCKRILSEIETEPFELIDIKQAPITAEDLDVAATHLGSYENLFNKRAMKYKSQGLNQQDLTEADFRRLILEEYTFLKRPLFIIDDQVFSGNSKKVISSVKDCLPH